MAGRRSWLIAGLAVAGAVAGLLLGLHALRGKYEERNRLRQAKDGVRALAMAARMRLSEGKPVEPADWTPPGRACD